MKLSPEILAEIERMNARIRFRAPSEGGAAPAPPPPTDPPAERKPGLEPPDTTPALAADILEEIERLQKRIRFRDPSEGGAGFVIPPPPAPPAGPKPRRTPSRPAPSSPSLDLFEAIEREHARLRNLLKHTQGAGPDRQVPSPPSPKLRPPTPSGAAPAARRRRRSFAPRTRLDRAKARVHGLSKRPPKTPPPA